MSVLQSNNFLEQILCFVFSFASMLSAEVGRAKGGTKELKVTSAIELETFECGWRQVVAFLCSWNYLTLVSLEGQSNVRQAFLEKCAEALNRS